ncbi:MAG: ATP-dependent DNA ligase [Chthoniobacterales bacterium]|nr:ATP-dependent DNA ligase [Chthoniobacterales bacterium]
MIQVHYERGVYLPNENIWLDPWDAKPFAFVSHAHSDHIAAHEEIIVSERTARLMQARLPGKRNEYVLAFGEPTAVRGLDVTLLPAGHIFGSAQFFLRAETGTLLYTGDFKLRPGRSAEATQWQQADTLIMETTYGLPRYRLPPTELVVQQIVAFCREALEDGATPVLLGYSLGKAQEILCSLSEANLQPMLHGSVFRMSRIYEQFGQAFCNYERYDAGATAGKVLICPPSANRSRMIQRIKNKRVAMISGWAVEPNAIYRYQVDAAFPLSDHADYTDLIRYVELVQPKRVLTLHGFAAEFARDLRDRGIEAWALSQQNQLELTLGTFRGVELPPPPAAPNESNDSEFFAFATVGANIAATPAKLEKVRLLGDYLRTLDAGQLPIATIFLTGKSFAQTDQRTLQTGWAIIYRALLGASRRGNADLRQIAGSHGDASKTAFEALDGRTTPETFSLGEARALFDELHRTRGPVGKTEILQARLAKLSALEAQYVVKILTGDLRIGLREGLVEEAIVRAFDVPLDEVKEAHMLLGDIGEAARLASGGKLAAAELTVFRPIKCMLASPEPTAEAIWARFADRSHGSHETHTTYVEDKFDGIRAQLHRDRERVEIFSRDLRRITDQFPELTQAARSFADEVLLDGEIMAFEQGKKLTFFDLQKRLGRKSDGADLFAAASADVPVVFVAFDLLWLNGRSLLKTPLRERRNLLRRLTIPSRFQIAGISAAKSAEEIEAAFQMARRRLNEGLMIKDPESQYTPGRRGLSWFKLKKELATLDVVVVAAELGHGKRNHVLSDYTFAVRDKTSGQLLPIGKAYSGLTDVEIAELTEHFRKNTVNDRGRYLEVKPDTVLEIAFDSIQPSTRYASGLALRFPRIKAIRRDKTLDAIDTLAYAQKLSQQTR